MPSWPIVLVAICWAATAAATSTLNCDLVHYIGENENFEVASFPPKYQYEYGSGPRECALTFKAKPNSNCTLEWLTTHHESGDGNCKEQHFRFGDENEEQRVCGFLKPPARLESTGRELFLAHFARKKGSYRHRDTQAVTSHLGGVVHCRQQTEPCPPQPQYFGDIFSVRCPLTGGFCAFNASVTVNGSVVNRSGNCTAATSRASPPACPVTAIYYLSFAPITETCSSPPPVATPLSLSNCFTMQGSCPMSNPSCIVKVEIVPSGGGLASHQLLCAQSAQPGALCTLQASFCISDGSE